MEKTDSDPVKRLYKYYDILAEAGDDILEHESVFHHIMDARLGNFEEKRLVCQFIPKFFPHFPHLAKASVSAQLDLCEDSSIVVRKQAVKEIVVLCRSNPSSTKQVAYFISQLLGAEDVGEGLLVRNTLISLFNIEPSATLRGIFAQIRDGSPKVQERCRTFLFNRLGSLNKSVISQIRDILMEEIEVCLENSNSEEISIIVPLVQYTSEDDAGSEKRLVQVLEKQLSLEKGKLTSDEEDMNRIYEFTKLAKPNFSKGVDSGVFVNFYCSEILPLVRELKGFESGSGQAAAILKQLSEISPFCSELPDALDCYKQIFTVLQDLLPMEPDPAGDDEKKHPRIHFTLIECLLTSLLELFHRVKSVDSSEYEQALEELRTGLKTLLRYVEPFRKFLSDMDKSAVDYQTRLVALRCFDNLKTLTGLFLAVPVKFSVILPSWSHAEVVATSTKKLRKPSLSLSTDHSKKEVKTRGVQQIYTPPGGKYSRTFKRF
ncbi:Hypothetical protein NTJ_13873 [Nesidiocoris tenuis]|uniref:Apoptosis inhibitor 5 n=1 Tax=Nesidiocoris tenuis TaxID=355587 RepID=A0ABN7BD43_9HEMI|nr:Hypothetical protein NTJ_13873 [Nesidiocoris tenuis]